MSFYSFTCSLEVEVWGLFLHRQSSGWDWGQLKDSRAARSDEFTEKIQKNKQKLQLHQHSSLIVHFYSWISHEAADQNQEEDSFGTLDVIFGKHPCVFFLLSVFMEGKYWSDWICWDLQACENAVITSRCRNIFMVLRKKSFIFVNQVHWSWFSDDVAVLWINNRLVFLN